MPVVIVGQKNWSRASLTTSLSLRCVKSHASNVCFWYHLSLGGNGIIIIIVIQREFEFSSGNSGNTHREPWTWSSRMFRESAPFPSSLDHQNTSFLWQWHVHPVPSLLGFPCVLAPSWGREAAAAAAFTSPPTWPRPDVERPKGYTPKEGTQR